MTEDGDEIPIGIVTSISLYIVYTHIVTKFIQMYKMDNMIVFIIYFVPFIILYIGIPIVIRKTNNRQKYVDQFYHKAKIREQRGKMTMKEKITESNIRAEATSITTGIISQVNMTKIEKMTNHIIEKFGVHTNIFKSGGRWSVMLENGYNTDWAKLKEIREYVLSHSEELEEDDNI